MSKQETGIIEDTASKSKQAESVDTEIQQPQNEDNKKDDSKEFTGEDNLELHKMNFSDRMKAKKERFRKNTEGMSTKEKISYCVYYYKWPVIISALLIFLLIYVSISVYKNTRPVALGYAVINSPKPGYINKDVFDEYMECYNFTNGYQITSATDIQMSMKQYNELYEQGNIDNNTDYSQFPLLCWNGYYDIIITDKAGLEYCSSESVIEPLDTALSDDIYSIVYTDFAKDITTAPNYNNDYVDYAINVSNNEFIKNLNVGYDEVYICFPSSVSAESDIRERNIGNRRRILKLIFNLDIEI